MGGWSNLLEGTRASPRIVVDLRGKHLTWSGALGGLYARAARWVLGPVRLDAAPRCSGRWFQRECGLVAWKGARIEGDPRGVGAG